MVAPQIELLVYDCGLILLQRQTTWRKLRKPPDKNYRSFFSGWFAMGPNQIVWTAQSAKSGVRRAGCPHHLIPKYYRMFSSFNALKTACFKGLMWDLRSATGSRVARFGTHAVSCGIFWLTRMRDFGGSELLRNSVGIPLDPFFGILGPQRGDCGPFGKICFGFG